MRHIKSLLRKKIFTFIYKFFFSVGKIHFALFVFQMKAKIFVIMEIIHVSHKHTYISRSLCNQTTKGNKLIKV